MYQHTVPDLSAIYELDCSIMEVDVLRVALIGFDEVHKVCNQAD